MLLFHFFVIYRLFSRKISTYGMPLEQEAEDAAESAQKQKKQAAKPPAINPRQMLLQSNIRNYAIAFLRDTVVTMPAIPDAPTYERLQREYQAQLHARIERERSVGCCNGLL